MTSLVVDSWQDTAGTAYKECLQVVTAQWDQNPDQYWWFNGTGSTGYFDTGLNVQIKAKKASSKFFVIADCQGYYDTASTGSGFNISIFRDSTQVAGGSNEMWMGFGNSLGASNSSWSLMRTAYDSPNVAAGTTLTYKVYFGRYASTTSRIGFGWPSYISFNKIIVMELEG